MPISTKTRVAVALEEVLTGVSCNVCGKEADLTRSPGFPYGFHQIEVGGGYGDRFPADMDTLKLVACDDCLEAWVKTFKHQDVITSAMWPSPLHAVMDGTREPILVSGWWAYPADQDCPEGDPIEEDDGLEWPSRGLWQHFKGGLYEVMGEAYSLSNVPHVLYRPLYGDQTPTLRPLVQWTENVDRGGYSGPRFAPLTVTAEPDNTGG